MGVGRNLSLVKTDGYNNILRISRRVSRERTEHTQVQGRVRATGQVRVMGKFLQIFPENFWPFFVFHRNSTSSSVVDDLSTFYVSRARRSRT